MEEKRWNEQSVFSPRLALEGPKDPKPHISPHKPLKNVTARFCYTELEALVIGFQQLTIPQNILGVPHSYPHLLIIILVQYSNIIQMLFKCQSSLLFAEVCYIAFFFACC